MANARKISRRGQMVLTQTEEQLSRLKRMGCDDRRHFMKRVRTLLRDTLFRYLSGAEGRDVGGRVCLVPCEPDRLMGPSYQTSEVDLERVKNLIAPPPTPYIVYHVRPHAKDELAIAPEREKSRRYLTLAELLWWYEYMMNAQESDIELFGSTVFALGSRVDDKYVGVDFSSGGKPRLILSTRADGETWTCMRKVVSF
ncbi:MAG: hypothetical protein WC565_02650 [Parcubacteria group bacterium]